MTTIKRIYLPHDEFNFIRLFLQHREIYFIAGTNSLFVPSRQEKYIMYSYPDGTKICRKWTDDKGETYDMTPGEAARAELKKTFPNLRRVGWQSSHIRLFDWRWPMLFTGPLRGELCYIDLKGAYWQIYRKLWLDTFFPNGYGELHLATIADALGEWKGARNSLVGVCAARETIGVRGYKSVRLQTQNPYLSPGLWATIQAVLNELAFKAERYGAKYIATDGYIFDDINGAGWFEEYLLDNGFMYRRVLDEGEIKNWQAYKVGVKETKAYSKAGMGQSKPFRAMRLLDTEFPDRVLRWWAKSTTIYHKQRWSIEGVKTWQQS